MCRGMGFGSYLDAAPKILTVTQQKSDKTQAKMGLKRMNPLFWAGKEVSGYARMLFAKLLILITGAIGSMAAHKEDKPKKFFGFEVSDTISYVVVVVLGIIFIRQVMVLF